MQDTAGLRSEVRALVTAWQDAGRFTPRCDNWLRGFDPEFSGELAARGWLGLTWPTAAGGGGRPNTDRLVLTEELLRAGAPVAAHWMGDRQIGPAVLRHGSAALQEQYLPRIVAGEITFCLCMSETESGSDLASVRTRADRVDGGWLVRGGKIWTSHAHLASHAYLLARTGDIGSKHDGLSEFVVDMATPGITVRPILDLRGAHHFNEVTFDDVLLPAEALLGTEGNGWTQVTEQLAFERGGIERVLSSYPLLAAVMAAHEHPDPVAARTLGAALARLAALRRVARGVAEMIDEGRAPIREAAVLKDLGTAFEGEVNDIARALVDIEPDPDGSGIARLLADNLLSAPGFTIRGGTTEVLRTIVARSATAPGPVGGPELRAMADEVLTGQGGEPDRSVGDGTWQLISDLGWPGVGIDEAAGGSGGSIVDLLELLRATGRHSVSIPLAETGWAAALLAPAGGLVGDGPATVALANAALPVLADGRISGTVDRVPWGSSAARLLCVAASGDGPVLVGIDPAATGVTWHHGQNLAGEPRDDLQLDAAPIEVLRPVDVDVVRARGMVRRTAQLVGAMEAAVDSTVQHVTVRQQFGRPLVAFQAVGSQLAQMISELELAQAALRTVTDRIADDGDGGAVSAGIDRDILVAGGVDRVRGAFVVAATAAGRVARAAHQLHGAMGITREHRLHLSTRRLWSWRDEFGGPDRTAAGLGRSLLPQGENAVWDWIVGEVDG
ncbi:acyl-CoA dehydrogenase [Nakamurella sp. YIM 132087]|uniref:Acyl-CoA dehydrogenase n=1 Tax=Nakamurella alba TaxID=2665158 RepID=A0A7K1FIQ5_9ACTN|nr:acyl-CoA dehydrogenase family protein [Nakamurella alba]MTD13143.1 acyl-CoA dehydrogenase [Nakamurella alba]